jgi:thioredoxin-like negative regulator of GroEL
MQRDPTPLDPGWQVVCLCAAWCGVCRDWQASFDALAAAHPDVRFAWVDVEDEAEAMGDIDIETFPTLLVARGPRARFFGPVQPSPTQVARLLDSLFAAHGEGPKTAAEAHALLHRLQAGLLPKS